MACDPNCLLSDPEVGIITETDHKVGKCLCSLCTCGKHLCPSRHVSRYNAFQTSYASHYREPKTKPPQKFEPYLPYVGSQARMDVQSSMKSDYRPPKREERKDTFRARSSSPSLKFVSSTSYSLDYPNWGANRPSIEKRPNLPTRLLELRFAGQSTYKQDFVSGAALHRSFEEQRAQPVRANSMLKLTNANFCDETTSRKSFQQLGGFQEWNEVVKQKQETLLTLETPACHHVTTHVANFRPVAINPKDPSFLRRKKLTPLHMKV